MEEKKPFHRFPRVMLVIVVACAITGAILLEKNNVLGFFLGAFFGWWFVYPAIELVFTDFNTLD